MAVTYSATVRDARMTVVRDALSSGSLQIGTANMSAVIASFALSATAGAVASGVLTLAGLPQTVAASAGGRAAAARLRSSGGADVITGLVVGMPAGAAWAASTAYALGDVRSNGGKVYRVTAAGTSAASGGPSGTGSAITDGSATWEYLAPVGGDVTLDAVDITQGQSVKLSSAAFAHA